MDKKKRLVVAAVASSMLYTGGIVCPDLLYDSQFFNPIGAVAQAEGEVTQAAVELDLGKPLPLRVNNIVAGMPEYVSEADQRIRHWAALSIDANTDGKWRPMGIALEGYGVDISERTIQDPQEIITSLYVHRSDGLIVSFAESQASYKGGMRGRFAIVGNNYDAATGAELKWEDVFGSPNVVLNEVAMLLKRNYPKEAFAQKSVLELKEQVKKAVDEGTASWVMDPCGATFYFNMFSLSSDPYAPIYSATLNFSVNGFCFKDKYRHSPKEWCMEIEPRTQMRLTLDDSVINTTEIQADTSGLRIILGGPATTAQDGIINKTESVFTDHTPMQGARPVFVKMADGRKYFYIDCHLAPDPAVYQKGYDEQTMAQLENQHELRVYELVNGQIKPVECDNGFTMKNEIIGDAVIPTEWFVMTDPNEFKLNKTGVPLRESHRICRVNEKGQPEVIAVIQ